MQVKMGKVVISRVALEFYPFLDWRIWLWNSNLKWCWISTVHINCRWQDHWCQKWNMGLHECFVVGKSHQGCSNPEVICSLAEDQEFSFHVFCTSTISRNSSEKQHWGSRRLGAAFDSIKRDRSCYLEAYYCCKAAIDFRIYIMKIISWLLVMLYVIDIK